MTTAHVSICVFRGEPHHNYLFAPNNVTMFERHGMLGQSEYLFVHPSGVGNNMSDECEPSGGVVGVGDDDNQT